MAWVQSLPSPHTPDTLTFYFFPDRKTPNPKSEEQGSYRAQSSFLARQNATVTIKHSL